MFQTLPKFCQYDLLTKCGQLKHLKEKHNDKIIEPNNVTPLSARD